MPPLTTRSQLRQTRRIAAAVYGVLDSTCSLLHEGAHAMTAESLLIRKLAYRKKSYTAQANLRPLERFSTRVYHEAASCTG